MKKTFLIIIIFTATLFRTATAQTLSTQLHNFPVADYLNKPIDTLIAHLPAGYDTAFIILSGKTLNHGASLEINYPPNDQFWLEIDIADAQYITVQKDFTQGRPEVLWPFSLLRKEKIGRIRIHTGQGVIIKDSDNF
jgi:hypothetical protein